MVTYMEHQTAPIYMSVKCAKRTLCIPNFTRAPHAQPSLSNIPKWDSNFSEPSHSHGTTDSDKSFQLPPKIKIPNLHIVGYTCQFKQYHSHRQNECRAHPSWAPTKEPTVSCWRLYSKPQPGPLPRLLGSYLSRLSAHNFIQIK